MLTRCSLNGKLLSQEETSVFLNRSFLFGDGFFETMRISKSAIPLWPYHEKRLLSNLEILQFQWEETNLPELLHRSILQTSAEIDEGRARLTIYRSGGGAYLPDLDQPSFFISTTPALPLTIPETGLHIGLFEEVKLPSGSPLWNIKSCNSLPYVLAARQASKKGWDDILLLSNNDTIAESSSANLFIVSENQLITPPLSSGCVAGVMRQLLIEKASILGFYCLEKEINMEELRQADEIWLVNAFRGILWVKNFEGKIYKGEAAKECMKIVKNYFL